MPDARNTRIGRGSPAKQWHEARGVVENMNSRESEIPILFKKIPHRFRSYSPQLASRAPMAAASFASNDALRSVTLKSSMALFKRALRRR